MRIKSKKKKKPSQTQRVFFKQFLRFIDQQHKYMNLDINLQLGELEFFLLYPFAESLLAYF
jgi:hypothetical protein